MKRQTIIAGNWKMNPNYDQAMALLQDLAPLSNKDDVTSIVCPPNIYIQEAKKTLTIHVGAQNIASMDNGAYTGEISTEMLASMGIKYCIIGHSERRQYFNESNQIVNEKIKQCLKHDITAILCIGESEADNDTGQTEAVLSRQINESLRDIKLNKPQQLIVAYEPVWAIGTGKVASTAYAEDTHAFIRKMLAKQYTQTLAQGISILYGGSVKPSNAKELLKQTNIDGALIGGASLSAKDFAEIISMGD
jgi:triosephosphate isomerase